jgi:hypothetical protein
MGHSISQFTFYMFLGLCEMGRYLARKVNKMSKARKGFS